jgi:hypothetical protein
VEAAGWRPLRVHRPAHSVSLRVQTAGRPVPGPAVLEAQAPTRLEPLPALPRWKRRSRTQPRRARLQRAARLRTGLRPVAAADVDPGTGTS